MHDQIIVFFCFRAPGIMYIHLHDDSLASAIFSDIFLYPLKSSVMLCMGVPTS
jgi:hypothetical protein